MTIHETYFVLDRSRAATERSGGREEGLALAAEHGHVMGPWEPIASSRPPGAVAMSQCTHPSCSALLMEHTGAEGGKEIRIGRIDEGMCPLPFRGFACGRGASRRR